MNDTLILELEITTRETLERALHCYFVLKLLEFHPSPEDAFVERLIQLKILIMQEIESIIKLWKADKDYITTHNGLLRWKSNKIDLLLPIYLNIMDKNNSSIILNKIQHIELWHAIKFFCDNFLQNLETDPWTIKRDYQAYLEIMKMKSELRFWQRNSWDIEEKLMNLRF